MCREYVGKRYLLLFCMLASLLTLQMRAFAAESASSSSASESKAAAAFVKGKTVKGGITKESKIPVSSGGKFKKSGNKYRYIYPDGTRAKGWKKINGKVYCFSASGNAYKGKKKLGKYYYYFAKKGLRQTGWVTIDGKKYYFFKKKNGVMATGYVKLGKRYYYFKEDGEMLKSIWVKQGDKYIYFRKNGKQAFGWLVIGTDKYYFDRNNGGGRVTGKVEIEGSTYSFSESGKLTSAEGPDFKTIDTSPSGNWGNLKRSTLKKLLLTAMKPVGTTMYVWGGGWSWSGTGSAAARTIGVNPGWEQYFNQQNSSYNYKNMPQYNDNGLDCSGFVGWVMYNTFNTSSGNTGYVMGAEYQARTFANYGWGSYTPYYEVSNYRAGDVMSLAEGHVYIVVGSCSDGSIVLIHSSPNGVMISGTTTRSGNKNSKAIQLSDYYMRYYYPAAYAKFNTSERHIWRNEEYLTKYSRMRWYLGDGYLMSDPDGYSNMNAEQILKDLFNE